MLWMRYEQLGSLLIQLKCIRSGVTASLHALLAAIRSPVGPTHEMSLLNNI
jgi:hypothetical protein